MMGPILGGSPRIRFDSTLNIVCDGNSLTAGQGAGQDYPRILAKTAPLAAVTRAVSVSYDATFLANSPYTGRPGKFRTDKGIVILNDGVNGETWRKMNGLDGGTGPAAVDAAYLEAATSNVLVCAEGTNAIVSGRTAAQAFQDAKDYIAARKALHAGWRFLLGTCLPRQLASSEAATIALNAVIDEYNALLRAQYRSMGAHGLFDVRQAGSKFNLPDYTYASFAAALADPAGLWTTTDGANALTHLSTNGYAYEVYNMIVPALMRLPAR